MTAAKTLRTCPKGHRYYKSTDCPTCPVCEAARKPGAGFMAALSAPAQRALENAGITTVKQLSRYSEPEIMKLHGMGPSTIPRLRAALEEAGLDFAKDR